MRSGLEATAKVYGGILFLLAVCGAWEVILPQPTWAQSAVGGLSIQLYGTVQVEPGQDVITLGVKNEEIRFGVHNVRSSERDFAMGRFMVDARNRTPGLLVRGAEPLLDLLIKERPGKRALKLTGVFYYDSRMFLVHDIEPFREKKPPSASQ